MIRSSKIDDPTTWSVLRLGNQFDDACYWYRGCHKIEPMRIINGRHALAVWIWVLVLAWGRPWSATGQGPARPVTQARHESINRGTDQEIYGKRTMANGTIKENLGGRSKIVLECKTEAERLSALKEWFGITFMKDEAEGIRGWITELREGYDPSDFAIQELWHITKGKHFKLEYQKSIM